MKAYIINDERLREKEEKVFRSIILIVFIISLIFIGNLFFIKDVNTSDFELTLGFIRLFNSILSILAFGSCLISYNRLKKDSVFIISLIYLILFIDISMGQLDYLSFYHNEYNLSNYITISTSILRVFLLIIAISPKNKISNLISNNKHKSIIFVSIYTIIVGYIEGRLKLINTYDSSILFVLYNIILIFIYCISTYRLFKLGIKEKEYLFIVLGSSIFMLAIKAAYAIYAANTISFYLKLISVAITYISFLVIIAGLFIELYMYISKGKVLNDNLKIFYNMVEHNKHSYMYICNEDNEILYANKKIRDNNYYYDGLNLNKLEILINKKRNILDLKEMEEHLSEKGFFRGILKDEENNKTIDYSVQLINTGINSNDMTVNFIDISDEINMELELEKYKIYDKEKSNFISNISHELRTPLNIFYSTIQLLDIMNNNYNYDFRVKYREYNNTLHINCKRMMRLINNIVDISEIDAGISNPKFGNYDIVSLVEDITLATISYALLKSIDIQFDTDVEEHIIKCDPSMIEKIMLNLLSNAIKFSGKDKMIYVNLSISDEWVKIYVKDEGIGISKDVRNIIFEKFVQVDKSHTRINEGSGIGLSIVKTMIDAHNGCINVDSQINKGSTFSIFLPNEYLENSELRTYTVNTHNVELEFSDIYELSR